MKKVINNRLYNTDTAHELGTWANMADVRNFNRFTETLYQKRTGEYFIHGVGGPASKYAETIGQNTWSGGEKIIPMTFENARKWVEEHLTADEFESIFGLPSEDEAPVTLSLQIPADLDAIIRQQAAEQGLSLTAFITGILDRVCRD